MYLFESTTTTTKKDSQEEDEDKEQQSRLLVDTKIGLTSNCISLVLLYPIQLAITNIIVGNYNGSIEECLVSSVGNDGFKSIYNGLLFAILGTINYQTVYIQLYNQFVISKKKNKQQQQPVQQENDESISTNTKTSSSSSSSWIQSPVLRQFLIDQCITCVSCYFAYPYETIRHRLQLQQGEETVSSSPYYQGIEVRILKTLLEKSILFLYDQSQYDIIRKVSMKLFH